MWGTGGEENEAKALQGNFSSDGVYTWSDHKPMKLIDGSDLISYFSPALARTKSGRIGLIHQQRSEDFNKYTARSYVTFHSSDDEGKTWSKGLSSFHRIARKTLISISFSSGRLLIPFKNHSYGPTPRDREANFVVLFGQRFRNSYAANLNTTTAYYSDDEGKRGIAA